MRGQNWWHATDTVITIMMCIVSDCCGKDAHEDRYCTYHYDVHCEWMLYQRCTWRQILYIPLWCALWVTVVAKMHMKTDIVHYKLNCKWLSYQRCTWRQILYLPLEVCIVSDCCAKDAHEDRYCTYHYDVHCEWMLYQRCTWRQILCIRSWIVSDSCTKDAHEEHACAWYCAAYSG